MSFEITVDGKRLVVDSDKTVLEAARDDGITIPTLCYHKDLSPTGSCRLCVVEVEGMRTDAAACTTEVYEGMVVRTESPRLAASRRSILNLLLENYYDAGHNENGPAGTEFMHWVNKYGARLPAGYRALPRYRIDSDPNPFVRVDLNKCILCTRCVRACAEVQGRFVWGIAGRGKDARLVAGAEATMLEARCESCGACVAYCPTGALDNSMAFGLGTPDKRVTTTCTYCGVGCQFDLNVKDGRVIGVTSNPSAPVNGMSLCVKGRYGYDFIHHHDRLTRPKVRKYLLEEQAGGMLPDYAQNGRQRGEWVDVDWDTALSIVARKLAATRDVFGPDSIGVLTSAKCLNEENYLMNKFARQVIGTNNVDHCARL